MAGSDCNGSKRQRTRPSGDRKRWPRHGRPASCDTCGAPFTSQYSCKTAGGWTRFCGAACYQLSRTIEAGRLPRLVVTSHHGHCEGCGHHYRKTIATQRYCSDGCRPSDYEWTPAIRECTCCGVMFEASKWQRTCSEACAHEVSRRARRTSKAKRRAAKRGAKCERFDPIEVLARDGWRCQLCGVSTPQRLRGSCDPRAPELDHVVPLAAGGAHSRSNTQCACRACNNTKGAKPLGHLGLQLAA